MVLKDLSLITIINWNYHKSLVNLLYQIKFNRGNRVQETYNISSYQVNV